MSKNKSPGIVQMFSATVNEVNGSAAACFSPSAVDLNKRSTVCDADSNGRVNPNCRR